MLLIHPETLWAAAWSSLCQWLQDRPWPHCHSQENTVQLSVDTHSQCGQQLNCLLQPQDQSESLSLSIRQPSVLSETHVVGTVFRLFCKREISTATILILTLMILPLFLRGHWRQTNLSGAITHWRKSDGLICLVHSKHLCCLCLRI